MAAAPKKNAPRVEPQITTVSTAVAMPVRSTNRGSKTNYPFASLNAVGTSFGVLNKTAEQLASIVSNQNRKAGPVLRDANGAIRFKTDDMKDPNGAVIGQVPAKDKKGRPVPMTDEENKPHYFAIDTDPKTDPDKAKARVFRDK